MKGDNVEISIQIGGEWKPLKHVDMGRDDDQSVVRVLKSTGETVTLDDEKTKAFLKACMSDICDDYRIQNYQLELFKRIAEQASQAGSRIAVMRGRQFGNSESHRRLLQILEHEIGNPTPPDENCAFSFKPRRCDCLKCRMGQSHHCMTFSPKKRRGK